MGAALFRYRLQQHPELEARVVVALLSVIEEERLVMSTARIHDNRVEDVCHESTPTCILFLVHFWVLHGERQRTYT